MMENIIFNELNVRGYSVDVGNQVLGQMGEKSYERKTTEIDFVANQGSKRYYIQSAWNMPTAEKRYTEKRPLLEIRDSFKKIIIVGDDIEHHYDENGILLMGLKDFLLNVHSLDF